MDKTNYGLMGIAYLLPEPAAPGSNPSIPENVFRGKIFNVAGLINCAGERKVDSGLKMLIKLI